MNMEKNNQTNLKCENNRTKERITNTKSKETKSHQVLRGSAMCLQSQTGKRAKTCTNKSNEYSKELQRRIFQKNLLTKASPNPKYKFFPNPNWNHTKKPLTNKEFKDPTEVPHGGTPKELSSRAKKRVFPNLQPNSSSPTKLMLKRVPFQTNKEYTKMEFRKSNQSKSAKTNRSTASPSVLIKMLQPTSDLQSVGFWSEPKTHNISVIHLLLQQFS